MEHFDLGKDSFYNDIASTIKRFYPYGVEPESLDTYGNHPHTVLRQRLLSKYYQGTPYHDWREQLQELRDNLKLSVQNLSEVQNPSFTAQVCLETIQNERLSYIMKIVFSVSLLGPYYYVLGLEGVKVNRRPIDNEEAAYHGHLNYALYPSPFDPYEDEYQIIKNFIESHYPGYRQVPYHILKQTVPGLSIDGLRYDLTVCDAIFNQCLRTKPRVHGNEYFGSENWKSDQGGKWEVKPGF